MSNSECHQCGGTFPDHLMADWTICRSCMQKHTPDDHYMDSLGITWSPKELEEAGGKAEVERLCRESKS